jgi:hypothetical protein
VTPKLKKAPITKANMLISLVDIRHSIKVRPIANEREDECLDVDQQGSGTSAQFILRHQPSVSGHANGRIAASQAAGLVTHLNLGHRRFRIVDGRCEAKRSVLDCSRGRAFSVQISRRAPERMPLLRTKSPAQAAIHYNDNSGHAVGSSMCPIETVADSGCEIVDLNQSGSKPEIVCG